MTRSYLTALPRQARAARHRHHMLARQHGLQCIAHSLRAAHEGWMGD